MYRDKIMDFKIETNNPKKDTLDYILLISNKTEWIRRAIELNQYETPNYIWVDFGIRKIYQGTDKEFINSLNNLYTKCYTQIRIGHIWDLSYQDYGLNIRKVLWYFAGMFGGDKDSLVLFAGKMKEKVQQIIRSTGTITWEVNLWYLIYLDYPDLFNPYQNDHNRTLIDHY